MALRIHQGHVLGGTALLAPPLAIFVPKAISVLLVAAAAASLLCSWLAERRWPRPPQALTAAALPFFLWAALSAAWSMTPWESLTTALPLGGTFLAGLVLASAALRLDEGARDVFARACVAAGGIGFSLLAVELAGGGAIYNRLLALAGRPMGAPEYIIYFFNPGISLMALFLWPWLAVLWRQGLPILAVVFGALGGAVIAAGDADAPRVALLLGAATFALALLWPRAAPRVLGAAVAVAVLAAPLVPAALPPVEDLVRQAPNLPPSLYHRVSIWQVTVRHLAEAPVAGHGFDTARAFYGAETQKEQTLADAAGVVRWTSQYEPIPLHPHNGILQVWLELGAVGALFGLAVLLALVRGIAAAAASGVDRALACGALVTGLFIASVSFGLWQSWWMCGLWLMGALTLAATAGRGR